MTRLNRSETAGPAADGSSEYLTMKIGGQTFGIAVLEVQDVLSPQRITRIPLVAAHVAGVLNLRGRIVTAIDARCRLGLPKPAASERQMSVVVEHHGELYSIIVDEVGEVLPLRQIEPNPPTLNALWREISSGVVRLQGELLVIVDISRLLDFSRTELAH